MSAHFTEAIYADGVFRPLEPVELADQQRVRITFEPIVSVSPEDRKAALSRARAIIERMNFRHGGPYPTRDELHERR